MISFVPCHPFHNLVISLHHILRIHNPKKMLGELLLWPTGRDPQFIDQQTLLYELG